MIFGWARGSRGIGEPDPIEHVTPHFRNFRPFGNIRQILCVWS